MEEQTLGQEQGTPQCIFCHIASGKVASRKVYEDDKVLAVLDINPANPGHVLLLTKQHFVILPQIPDPVVEHLGMVAKGISHALLRALKAQGTNIFVANGIAAGQRAQHVMVHVIPRMENDGLSFALPEHRLKPEELELLQKAFRGEKIEKQKKKEAREEKAAEEEAPAKGKEAQGEEKPAKKKQKKIAGKKGGEKKEATNLDEITRVILGR
jgi:histidine triad (HIT) family protein